MKRYILKKDLPTFKAGSEFKIKSDGCLYLVDGDHSNHWKSEVMAYHRKTLEAFPNILTDWFVEVRDFEPDTDWGVVVTSKLAGIEVADENYYEYDEAGKKKELFTWDEAMEIEEKLPDGWRLPTRSEWVLLAEEFGQDGNGKLDKNTLCTNLQLPLSGYCDDNVTLCSTTSGYYWSRTALDNNYAYLLYFNSSGGLYPQSNVNKWGGYAVRCVRDKEEK